MLTKKFVLLTALLLLLGLVACGPSDPPVATAVPDPTTASQPAGAAGEAARPPAITSDGQMQWDAPPPMIIDPSVVYLATFRTDKGDIVVTLILECTSPSQTSD